ncbi:TniQ family protein [Pseudomonas viridiflava]|uniref:TniQ family protein n=1 Tax=Pseudomonas viridiflava TaxID=33069 RepID=UPI0013CEB573|nr:TniQ family protein [Pseudomonas viridiflava]MCQ9390194.1 TniQ family protein [Pseudomonas viridiflava]
MNASTMRSNAHFGGLLKPVPGEAFSAWLGRGLRAKSPAPFRRAADCLERWGIQDANIPCSEEALKDFSEALGLTSESLLRTFSLPSDWLKAPAEERRQFCMACLINDFCCDRQPTSRIIWFYWWFTVCPVHGLLLYEEDSTSAPTALVSFLRNLSFAGWRLSGRIERRSNLGRDMFKRLLLMASAFQEWYLASVQRRTFIIGDVDLAASVAEVELVMADVLAIIGKKRSYPVDQRSYIAQLLGIKSWCSLRSDLSPEAGCEPFLCLDIREHNADIRMAMFALLGLFLKLPKCAHIWYLGQREPNNWQIEHLWRGMLCDAVRVPSYQAWFQQRSGCWCAHLRAHFHYLLDR